MPYIYLGTNSKPIQEGTSIPISISLAGRARLLDMLVAVLTPGVTPKIIAHQAFLHYKYILPQHHDAALRLGELRLGAYHTITYVCHYNSSKTVSSTQRPGLSVCLNKPSPSHQWPVRLGRKRYWVYLNVAISHQPY